MDRAFEQITDFIAGVRPDDVPGPVIEYVTGILVDSIACAMAARDFGACALNQQRSPTPMGVLGVML